MSDHPVNQIEDLLGIPLRHYGTGGFGRGVMCGATDTDLKITRLTKNLTCYACMEVLLRLTENALDKADPSLDPKSRDALGARRWLLRKMLGKNV